MMRQAVDDGLIDVNPFAGIKIDLSSDRSKNRYLPRHDYDAILEACPDQEWRVIVTLCRIAGLRGPSEITPLKWSDVSWERGRFTVTSPKTERYGKATRVVPLFDELRQELADLFEVKGETSQFVITRYRDSTTSLSTRFNTICVRAGVEEIPKPFPNMRASARRDLKRFCAMNDIDPAAVTLWLGHDNTTAEKYYDRVTEDDYQRAVGTAVGTSVGYQDSSTEVSQTKKPRENGAFIGAGGSGGSHQYTPEELESSGFLVFGGTSQRG